MSVESKSGFKYFVLFIDDYSRKTWIYFLKAKDEVFDIFQEFRSLVENQTGGEYTSKEFVDYCATMGIKKDSSFLTILDKMEWPRERTRP